MRKKKETATVYDVAKLAGVSPATVSRFLNRTTYVSDDKSQKIENAINTLDYKPVYQQAQTGNRRTMTIGALVQHPDSPFTSQILNDMEKVLIAQGYQLTIASGHWDKKIETHALTSLAQQNIDGLIVVTGNLTNKQLIDFSEKIPVIAVGYEVKANRIRCINIDNELAGYMATLHLLQLGHTNIGHIKGLASQPDSLHRFEGYKRALKEAGLRPNQRLIKQGDFSSAVAYQQTVQLLNDEKAKVTAIFAANDLSAYGVIKAIHDNGLRVPDDISVIGFDDLPTSEYFTPGLTTLRQPIEAIGTVSAHSILNFLSGERHSSRLPPINLIVRQSTQKLNK
ncbi:substrate-binding domain-containing protein [Vibrio sp. TH_r3]|uniref:LacI family DNA-binding transcriptional regulator n=1 Tax=unclassified Vibrio TaxID=2614977 RepID=UPI002954E8BE|nr:substrate-binding domain-containing protein [Vibrio sp. TH_r3]MDV7103053.1 substrate-binding domain-containing protein [Vibrio sp. TH_r3]